MKQQIPAPPAGFVMQEDLPTPPPGFVLEGTATDVAPGVTATPLGNGTTEYRVARTGGVIPLPSSMPSEIVQRMIEGHTRAYDAGYRGKGPVEPAVMTAWRRSGIPQLLNAGVGFAKEAEDRIQRGGQAIRSIPVVGPALDALPSVQYRRPGPVTGPEQQAGAAVERVAEFLIPGRVVRDAGTVVEAAPALAKLPAVLRQAMGVATRSGLEAATAGTIAAGQDGDAQTAAVLSGATPIIGAVAGPFASVVKAGLSKMSPEAIGTVAAIAQALHSGHIDSGTIAPLLLGQSIGAAQKSEMAKAIAGRLANLTPAEREAVSRVTNIMKAGYLASTTKGDKQ